MSRKPAILGASLIAGLGTYCPIPILRGAMVGLLPGVALRSWPTIRKGIIFGAAADLFISVLWLSIGIDWEPRGGYNHILAFYLPPIRNVITHTQGGQASAFFPSLMLWWASFHFLWARLWSPRPSLERLLGIVVAGQGVMLCAATFLWCISPMDGWWHVAYKPHRIESPILFLMVFLPTMPLCSWLVAWLLSRTPAPVRDPLVCRKCEYNLTGNISGVCPECGTPINDRQQTGNIDLNVSSAMEKPKSPPLP